ncbi:hypothetical protein PMIN06_004159 [Paraphaeosphaeria minitans]
MPAPQFQNIPVLREANLSLIHTMETHPEFPTQQTHRGGHTFMHGFSARTNAIIESLMNNIPPSVMPATRGNIPIVAPSVMTENQRKELELDAFGRYALTSRLVSSIDL